MENTVDDVEGFRSIWNGNDEAECVDICWDLQKAGIEYRVTQRQVSRIGMTATWSYQVGVPDTAYESARRVAGLDADADEIEQQAFEILPAPVSQPDLDEERRAASYLTPLNQNEATAEVWSQNLSDNSSIVELALKENLIRYRIRHTENGIRKFLVNVKDEPKAREILHQIKNGEPPS
jgi:hypothetical protein